MNPHLCRVALRPRDPFEVLDLTWRLLRERSGPILRLSAVVLLPVWLVSLLACWLADGHWAIGLLAVPIARAVQAPFTLLLGRMLFEDDVRVVRVVRDFVPLVPAALWTGVVALLVWTASASTCFAALPWARAAFAWMPETALLERVGANRSVRRAIRLAGGQPLAAFVASFGGDVMLVWFALAGEATGQAVVGFVLQLGAPFGALQTGQVTPWLVGGLLAAQPIHAAWRLLLYVDARTRLEGWDLQVGLRAAGLVR